MTAINGQNLEARVGDDNDIDIDIELNKDEMSEDERRHHESILEHQLKPWYKQPNVKILIVVLIIFHIGTGCALSSFITLTMEFVCRNSNTSVNNDGYNNSNHTLLLLRNTGESTRNITLPSVCYTPSVQATTSRIQLVQSLVGGAIGLVVSAILSRLSDRIGRKPIFIHVIIATFVSNIVFLTFVKSEAKISPYWLIISSIFDGIQGNGGLLNPITTSYIADTISPKDRSRYMSTVLGVFFLGIFIGPLVGGYLIKKSNNRFFGLYILLTTDIICIFLFLFVVNESRTKTSMRRSKELNILEIGIENDEHNNNLIKSNDKIFKIYLKKIVKTFLKPLNIFSSKNNEKLKSKKSRKVLKKLLIISIVGSIVGSGFAVIILLYPTYVFKWDSSQGGYFFSLIGGSSAIVLMIILPIFLKLLNYLFIVDPIHIDRIDTTLLQIGSIIGTFGTLGLFFAKTTKQYMGTFMFSSLAAFSRPGIENAFIKYTPSHRVGELQGGLSVIASVVGTISGAIFLLIYSILVKFSARSFYLLLFLFSFPLVYISFSFLWDKDTDEDNSENYRNEEVEPEAIPLEEFDSNDTFRIHDDSSLEAANLLRMEDMED